MEVAAAKNDEGKRWPAALPLAAVVAMCALSVLFAGLGAWVLGPPPSGAGAEKKFSDVVWRLSPLICAYLFFWTVALSAATTTTGALVRELIRASSLPSLAAAAAAKLVGPHAGAAAMFLGTVYSATASGRALADRRLRAGTKPSAAAAAAESAPAYQSRAEEAHERCLWSFHVFVVVCAAAVTAVAVLLDPPAPEAALDGLVFLAGPCLVVARLLLMHGGAFDTEVGETGWVAMFLGAVGWVVVAVLVDIVFGELAVMVFVWVAAMGMAGFLGYGLGVRASYKQLVAMKRSQPRTAQDASGLLVGRDEEDACSAHIDVAAGVDIDLVFPRCSRCRCCGVTAS